MASGITLKAVMIAILIILEFITIIFYYIVIYCPLLYNIAKFTEVVL